MLYAVLIQHYCNSFLPCYSGYLYTNSSNIFPILSTQITNLLGFNILGFFMACVDSIMVLKCLHSTPR